MGKQAKDLVVVPVAGGAGAVGPRAVVTLFSCSEGERSWEWRDKQRGFFSYYLEQGLRRDAADSKGTVHVSKLVSYLEKSVAEAVKREKGHDQRPYSIVEGSGAQDLILAQSVPGRADQAQTVAVLTPTGDMLQGRYAIVIKEGQGLLKSHRWDEAQTKFAAARELQPTSAQAAAGLGESYVGMKRFDEAERLFQQAQKLDPTLADAVRGLGETAFNKHDYVNGERLIRQAYEMDPKNPNTVGDMGLIYLLVKHDMATAERHLNQAHALDPANSDAVVGLGLVALKKGDLAGADRLLRRQYQADPKDSMAALGMGLLAYKKPVQHRCADVARSGDA